MLNDSLVMSAAEATARRVLEDSSTLTREQQVNRLFEVTLGRPATSDELAVVGDWIETTRSRLESRVNRPSAAGFSARLPRDVCIEVVFSIWSDFR